VGVRRLAGKEEALLERMANLPMPQHAQEAHGCVGPSYMGHGSSRRPSGRMRSPIGQRNGCTLARPPQPPLSCGFPSGFGHAERPLSLRRHSFASRPQDAPTLSWLIQWPSATISEAFIEAGQP
jgi:hypothetical protein